MNNNYLRNNNYLLKKNYDNAILSIGIILLKFEYDDILNIFNDYKEGNNKII